MDAVNGDAVFQFIETRLIDAAMGADLVTPQPSGFWEFNETGKCAVIGQQKKAFSIEVKTADGDEPREVVRERAKYGRAAFRVTVGGDKTCGLVKFIKLDCLVAGQWFAINFDAVLGCYIEGRTCQDLAVYTNTSIIDPCLGLATGAKTGARNSTGDTHGTGNRRALGLVGRTVARPRFLPGFWTSTGFLVRLWFCGFFVFIAWAHCDTSFEYLMVCGEISVMTFVRPEGYMEIALEEARLAAGRGEVPVGAVIVNADGAIVAQAGNETIAAGDPTAHAEILAIRRACAALGSERLSDCDLYVTLEPCAMCAAAISFARIRRLYFGAQDIKGGGVENGVRFFNAPSCHHAPEVYSGIDEVRAGEMLKEFFRLRR